MAWFTKTSRLNAGASVAFILLFCGVVLAAGVQATSAKHSAPLPIDAKLSAQDTACEQQRHSAAPVQIGTPVALILIQRQWPVPPQALVIAALCAFLIALAGWWTREHRIAQQRKMIRSLYGLGEEIIAVRSAPEVLKKLLAVLPNVLRVSGARMYLYNPHLRRLEQVVSPGYSEPLSIPLDSPCGLIPTGAALCYKNRSLLSVPDTRRSPFFQEEPEASLPRSILFSPMIAQKEVLGVVEMYDSIRARPFSEEEQAIAQHLANQIGIALKLIEQQSMREQLFRSERLAASAQLVSGVCRELRSPLDSISGLAETTLLHVHGSPCEAEFRGIYSEAQRASDIVERLVSLSGEEQVEVKLVDLNALLRGLMQFRAREWNAQGIQIRESLPARSLFVPGSQGQLGQVFLNLFAHAEKALQGTPTKVITIAANTLPSRVIVEIAFAFDRSASDSRESAPAQQEPGEAGALDVDVCRGIIQNHGGEIRVVQESSERSRFEVELPLTQQMPSAQASPATDDQVSGRPLTMMLLEPNASVRQHLLGLLSDRQHRVVPFGSPEIAADVVQRLHFDAVFCSMRPPGLNWVQFFQKVRPHVGTFVLLAESYDADVAKTFPQGNGHVLSKPIREPEFHRLLSSLESRLDHSSTATSRI